MHLWGDKGEEEGLDVDSLEPLYYPCLGLPVKFVIVSASEVTPEQRGRFKAYPAWYAALRNWLP